MKPETKVKLVKNNIIYMYIFSKLLERYFFINKKLQTIIPPVFIILNPK